jgi:hypothetical protein
MIMPRATPVTVLSPHAGDTITTGTNFPIRWTNTTAEPITLALRAGAADNSSQLYVMASTCYLTCEFIDNSY